MKYLIYIVASLLLHAFISVVEAESIIPFYNLNEEYGISIRETNNVCEDNNGFIWISSKMGIIRYIKDDVRIYQLPYENQDIITVELTYDHGQLLAYTNNGQIFKYNSLKDEFEMLVNVSKEIRYPYLDKCKVLVDNSGLLWISSSNGLFKYSTSLGLKTTSVDVSINEMIWKDNNHFFYADRESIYLYCLSDDSFSVFYSFENNLQNCVITSSKYYKDEHCLWLGTLSNGLYVINFEGETKTLRKIESLPSQPILAIESVGEKILLIGVDGQGIWEMDKFSKQILNVYKEDDDNPESLRGNGVYDIYIDSNNRGWVCTYSGGVSYYDNVNPLVTQIRHTVNNANTLINDDVNDVLEDCYGNLWFATNNGIGFLNTKTKRWKSLFHNNKEYAHVFLTLCEDDYNRIWAGTYSSGVYVIDAKSGNVLKHLNAKETNGKFNNDFIFDIMKEDNGNIWIGGVKGDLVCYDIKDNTYRSFANITVNKMLNYDNDSLFIGTTYGLLLFDKYNGKVADLIDNCLIYDIYRRGDELWLCTSGNGVVKYNVRTKEKVYLTVDDGLPSNFVTCIQYCDGFFWIGTEQGICRLDEKSNNVVTFNSLPILNNISFNLGAVELLDNGKLLWGTNKGALMFSPNEIKPVQNKGQIFLQELTVSGRSVRDMEPAFLSKPLDSLQEVTFRYYQNTMSLEMLPIGMVASGEKFSWLLENLDDTWSKPTNNKIISYSNIPSGHYVLHIRMYDSSNSVILASRDLVINIIPPYWQKLWFKGTIFSLILGIAAFLLMYYANRLKKVHSEEKIRFFTNIAHDIRSSLTLINGPIEELNKELTISERGSYYLHLATEQTHRLWNVVTQLMDFQKSDIGKEKLTLTNVDIVKKVKDRVLMFESFANSKSIGISFSSNVDTYVTAVDELLIEKVVDNLISNAVKYSYPNSEVVLSLQCLPTKWIFEVKDNGVGISKKAQRQLFREYYRAENVVNSKIVGSGIGLILVKNYVQLHGGRILCDSQLDGGTTFSVSIPVQHSDVEVKEPNVISEVNSRSIFAKLNYIPSPINVIEEKTSSKMKILIVEDNEYLREFLKSAMASNYNILLAEDGLLAWDVIQNQTPDLVISDVMMPNMDGFELCEKIKSTYDTSHIPVILLTALAGKAQQLQGLGLGADDYITKPFDVSILKQRISALVKNREIVRDKALRIISVDKEETAIVENQLNDKFLKKMAEVVNDNIANTDFNKNEFASAMNVSPSLLYKKVKSLTNLSPTDFIKSVRLNHAVELLTTKDYSVTEVSELCGFSSMGYFSTVFRKHYGKPPTQMV